MKRVSCRVYGSCHNGQCIPYTCQGDGMHRIIMGESGIHMAESLPVHLSIIVNKES